MRIGAQIEWRKDCWGKEARALYLGDLCCGSIMENTAHKSHKPGTPWRGWFSDDDEGNETGWFATAEEARASVEKALFAAIKFEAA